MSLFNAPGILQPATQINSPRVISLDVFRGFTMAVMIFVNELSSARGLPWWTYHAPGNVDVMTYVDMVFPFFLFIVGMSLPLSVAQRLKRNGSIAALWLHIALRSGSLIVLGLILANAEKADPARMGISGNLWALLGLISAGLYLTIYPESTRFPSYSRILRFVGLASLIILYAIFRRTTSTGAPAWIDGSYPEILGLIGYTYLAVATLYVLTRRWAFAPVACFVLLMTLCVITAQRILIFPDHTPLYFWPFGNGSMAAITMAGVVTSSIFISVGSFSKMRRPFVVSGLFALLCFAAGRLFVPLGISKIRATPTWSLYSVGASILVFALLYWICDTKGRTRWAQLLRPAGSNALLTYLLPDIWYFLLAEMGVTYFDRHLNYGAPAVAKTLLFTFLILVITQGLTKARIRLQL
jgi:heparan-alpha-glucosaminide N-acetyltransferase